MEMRFKSADYHYYEPAVFMPFSCETMREHIVPDSCADIARIVETTGQIRITGREVSGDGRFCVSGSIDVSVLYIPEKGSDPCALRFELPFQAYGDERWEDKCEFPNIRGELQNVDTRLLNPRKILTRVNLTFYPCGCQRKDLSVTTEIENDDSIQFLREQRRTRVVAAVREKEFNFLEELILSPGHDGAEEVLFHRVDLRGTDCKQIGSKLVVKGIVTATVLYRERGGRPEQVRQEFPFSQILDGSGLEEEWENGTEFQLLRSECTIGGEGGTDSDHVITLDLSANARVTVWRAAEIDFISDLYSTSYPVSCATEEVILRENHQRYSRRQNLREMLETGTGVKGIIDTEIDCGMLRQSSGGETVEASVRIRCLYLDENDALHSVRREVVVSCPAEHGGSTDVGGTVFCCGDIVTGIMPDGIELRFPVEFDLESSETGRYLCVSGGESIQEAEERVCPSLVLRKIGQEEDLWSVAKQYRTTCAAILEVNEIEEEKKLPRDRLLLIPRCR